MNQATLDQFEGVDAALLSGDLLYTDLEAVQDYLDRWQRVVQAHIDSCNQPE